jgi:hypothetical protein
MASLMSDDNDVVSDPDSCWGRMMVSDGSEIAVGVGLLPVRPSGG